MRNTQRIPSFSVTVKRDGREVWRSICTSARAMSLRPRGVSATSSAMWPLPEVLVPMYVTVNFFLYVRSSVRGLVDSNSSLVGEVMFTSFERTM